MCEGSASVCHARLKGHDAVPLRLPRSLSPQAHATHQLQGRASNAEPEFKPWQQLQGQLCGWHGGRCCPGRLASSHRAAAAAGLLAGLLGPARLLWRVQHAASHWKRARASWGVRGWEAQLLPWLGCNQAAGPAGDCASSLGGTQRAASAGKSWP